jgi:hypothetical protein
MGIIVFIEPALASDPIDRATAALANIGADAAKLQSYCDIVLTATPEADSVAAEEIEVKLDAYFESLGPIYAKLSRIGDEVSEDTEEGKKIDAAFDHLEAKCTPQTAKP